MEEQIHGVIAVQMPFSIIHPMNVEQQMMMILLQVHCAVHAGVILIFVRLSE